MTNDKYKELLDIAFNGKNWFWQEVKQKMLNNPNFHNKRLVKKLIKANLKPEIIKKGERFFVKEN